MHPKLSKTDIHDDRNPMSPNDLFLWGVVAGMMGAIVIMIYAFFSTP